MNILPDSHDPNKTLKVGVAPIELTGDPIVPLDARLKKILIYLGVAILLIIVALIFPVLYLTLAVTMPAAFGLAVYAAYLRYRVVEWERNKAPDWSKITVPPPKADEPPQLSDESDGVVFKN